MADYVEIRAATLPGFPYYFPYRTGVRLQATPTAEIQRGFDNDSNTATVVGLAAGVLRTTFFAGPTTAVTTTVSAAAQVTAFVETQLAISADVDASPPGLTGSLLTARATLGIQALPDYPELQRETFTEATLSAQLLTTPALELNRTLTALLAVRAELAATMLYNREGGNPLWLMFFYAGRGRYPDNPVPGSGSAEE